MVNRNGSQEKSEAPPYVSFKTVWNFLDKLGEIGTPPRIDRSVWGDTLSGGYGFQLMAALRFLTLIDENGTSQPELRGIADDVPNRKIWLRDRLVNFYGNSIQQLDLSQATMAQLQEAFRDAYSVTGATLNKAISFFLGAARAGEIPLSPYIERNVRRRTTTGKTKKKTKPAPKAKPTGEQTPAAGADSTPEDGDKHERIVTLKSGGTVRVSLSYNAFKLSPEDRKFVFDLIDKIQGYESKEGTGE